MARSCSRHGRDEIYKILVGRSEEEKPLGRPKSRWEDNIRMSQSE